MAAGLLVEGLEGQVDPRVVLDRLTHLLELSEHLTIHREPVVLKQGHGGRFGEDPAQVGQGVPGAYVKILDSHCWVVNLQPQDLCFLCTHLMFLNFDLFNFKSISTLTPLTTYYLYRRQPCSRCYVPSRTYGIFCGWACHGFPEQMRVHFQLNAQVQSETHFKYWKFSHKNRNGLSLAGICYWSMMVLFDHSL